MDSVADPLIDHVALDCMLVLRGADEETFSEVHRNAG